MSDLAIDVSQLVKTFGATRALDDFTLQVPTGGVAGFLGPNGAGKSTTIRVLLGLIRADSGTARVLGQDAWSNSVAIHRRLAYVPGDTNLWPNLTGGQAIDVLSNLRGNHGSRRGTQQSRLDELLERFELDPTKKARTYSKGNRQKVALVAAFASEADLYLLDEPTSGLDPLMEAVFTEEVRRLKAEGRTVLLSSHILAEVEKLCDTVTIIRAGRAVESGTLAELRHLTRSSVRLVSDGSLRALHRSPHVHDLTGTDGEVHFQVDDSHLDEVVRLIAKAGVSNLTITPPSLEELFMRHYDGSEAADR